MVKIDIITRENNPVNHNTEIKNTFEASEMELYLPLNHYKQSGQLTVSSIRKKYVLGK